MKKLELTDTIRKYHFKSFIDDSGSVTFATYPVMESEVGDTPEHHPDWAYFKKEYDDLNTEIEDLEARKRAIDEVEEEVLHREILPHVKPRPKWVDPGIGIEKLTGTWGIPNDETVCQEADRLVDSDRDDEYGHPKQDFELVGKLWGVALGCDPIPARTVGIMLILLKVRRSIHKHKRDSLVDICGYAKCLDMIEEVES